MIVHVSSPDRLAEVKAILFDTFGTLVDWRGSLIRLFRQFGEQTRIEASWDDLVDRWHAAYRPNLDQVRHGELPWTALDDLHRSALILLLPEFGLGSLPETVIARLTTFWHQLSPWPDTVAGLQRLRPRFILGPLSNGNLALMIDLAKFAGLPWDVVFGADLFRHYKPDPEIYLGACQFLRLQPQQVMLVAAHNYDLKAARLLGLRTAFVLRPREYGPKQSTDLTAEDNWDIVVGDLEALAQALGR